MEEPTYRIELENIFEGPMDLLVHLIKKHELDIYDIPIGMITKQYLGYIELMQKMNIDFAGEFLLMAATLTHIKSKMLLPVHDEEDAEDPRLEITRPLLEYLQMKSAAEELASRSLLGEDTFKRMPGDADIPFDDQDQMIKVGLFELIDAFQKILERAEADEELQFTVDEITVKDKINQLVDILEEKNAIAFDELFPSPVAKSEVIVTFLAVLEMVKMAIIRVAQHRQTGIISLFYQ